jgi:hypothetical protein
MIKKIETKGISDQAGVSIRKEDNHLKVKDHIHEESREFKDAHEARPRK